MTLVDERPDTDGDSNSDDGAARPAASVTVRRGVGSWRVAARLARREVRRRWGRSIMVVLLIAIPVAAMTAGDLTFRSDRGTYSNRPMLGSADARIDFGELTNDPTGVDFRAAVDPYLPDGTNALWITTTNIALRTKGGNGSLVQVDVSDVDLHSPLGAGMVGAIRGRFPRADDEVLLSGDVAHRFDVGVGETLTLVHPDQRFTVVGITNGVGLSGGASEMVAPGFDFDSLRPAYVRQSVLLSGAPWQSSPRASATALRRAVGLVDGETGYQPAGTPLVLGGANLVTPATFTRPVGAGTLAEGWLYGTLAMAVLGVIVAAAFAVSGRRQLVSIGQLSAQGAHASTVRRFLGLQGSVSGMIGAVLGLVAGIAIFRATATPLRLSQQAVSIRDLGIIGVTAVVVATLAAVLPSRALTRISVLTALGGRRPIGRLPRHIVPVGAVLLIGGLAGLVLSALGSMNGNSSSVLVLSALSSGATLAGICSLCPSVVQAVAALASRRAGTARLAARSLVRHRARSAALLASIIAVGAAGTALATYGEHTVERDRRVFPGLPPNVLSLSAFPGDSELRSGQVDPSVDPLLADPDARRHVEQVVGPVQWLTTQRAMDTVAYLALNFPDASAQPVTVASTIPTAMPMQPFELINATDGSFIDNVATIASDGLLDLLQVNQADRAALSRSGALFFHGEFRSYSDAADGSQQPLQPAIVLDDGTPIDIPVAPQTAHQFTSDYFLVTADLVHQLGLDIVAGPTYAVTPRPITAAQIRLIFSSGDYVRNLEAQQFVDLPEVPRYLSVDAPSVRGGDSSVVFRASISAGALLLVLLVVSFGMSLWAAEGRDEQRMLSAIGASPRSLARATAWRAMILTATGVVIAVPLGYGTVWAVTIADHAGGGDSTAPFPWIVAGAILIAVPILVAGASLVGSTLGQRYGRARFDVVD